MKQLRIVFTSDIHGQAEKLLQCAQTFNKNADTLVIDGGDILQGSPLSTYLHTQGIGAEPIARTLNIAGYDFITPGNHDFNYGPDYLRAYLHALNATCVCTNVHGPLPVVPYVIHTLPNGLKVGITGIVTDYVTVWEKAENLRGIHISNPFDAAGQALEQMKPAVDVSLCIYHGGFEGDAASTENIGTRICRELDFDILLTGHQHMPIEGELHHNTYIVQPEANAKHFIELTAAVDENGVRCHSQFISPAGEAPANQREHLTALHNDLQAWLDTPVGTLAAPMPMADRVQMALHGSTIAALYNRVQLEASGAQLSCVGLANVMPGFDRDVRRRHIVENYPFSNQLVTLKISGAQLAQVLERTASYLSVDDEGTPHITPSFLHPKVEHYNYDFFSGLTYCADLRRPVGARVSDVKVKGELIQPEDTFTLCLSNYRATGTGGYGVYTQCPVIEYGHEISDLVSDYISRKGNIRVENEEVVHWIYT